MPWGQIVGCILKVLAYIFDPEVRERSRRSSVLEKYRKLEEAHAIAWAEGDVRKASRIGRDLRELRERVRYMEGCT